MEDDGNHKATKPEKVNNTSEDTFVQNKEQTDKPDTQSNADKADKDEKEKKSKVNRIEVTVPTFDKKRKCKSIT